jgi:hypothetical protein
LKPGQLELGGALLKVGLLQLQEMRIPEHAAVWRRSTRPRCSGTATLRRS